jgi:hypothetical protein
MGLLTPHAGGYVLPYPEMDLLMLRKKMLDAGHQFIRSYVVAFYKI